MDIPHPSKLVINFRKIYHLYHHIIVNTAVGTQLCWQLTRCHRSQVSYGLIGWVGIGIKYSKPFVCICKHTATRKHKAGLPQLS